MSLDINSSKFLIREHRLKSIYNYTGTAEDLHQQLQKSTLNQQSCSFTQCTNCASFTANYQLAMIRDAAVVYHAPLGCTGDTPRYNFSSRGEQSSRGWKPANLHILCTNLREKDMVFGGMEKLRETIHEANTRFNPKVIFVTSSCASAIIGENIEGIIENCEAELNIPIVPIQCEGFRSKIWATGTDAAFHGILQKIVKPATRKCKNKINVINVNGISGYGILNDLFNKLGLEPNYIIQHSSIEQLEKLSEAAATVQICSTLGTYLAAGLEQHYNVPEIKAPPPYGIPGTDAWLTEIGNTLNIEQQVSELITSEKERVRSDLQELRDKLTGIKAIVAAGGGHGHGLINIIKDLNIELISGCTWHHDTQFDNKDIKADSLGHIINHYGNFKMNVCNKQAFELVNLLSKRNPDIFIVRHIGMAVLGAKLGIPTLILGDELYSVGYQGLLNFGNEILNTISNPTLFKNLKKHTKLPYTKWWLDQKPFSYKGGHRNE